MNHQAGTVGIMVGKKIQRLPVLRKYLHCNPTKMKLFCFSPTEIDWKHQRIKGLYLHNRKWLERIVPFPKVVYNRIYNSDDGLIKQLENYIGPNHIFNHRNQLNKLDIYNQLSRWLSQYLPETAPYDSGNAARFLDIHKLVYLKPVYGHQGKGVYRVERLDSGEIHISNHHFLPSIIVGNMVQFQGEMERLTDSTPYLIQKGIAIAPLNNRSFDIRTLVQKNKWGEWSVTNVVSRVAFPGCFNTSICERVCLSIEALRQLYSSALVNEILNTIYNISMRAAEIIELDTGNHLCEVSVDVALDKEGRVWIIEVNGKPQKDLYDDLPQKSKTVYSRPIEYAQFLHNR